MKNDNQQVGFTERQRAYLQSLPAVQSVGARRIRYTAEFRDECMRRYCEGESPAELFREAGLDPKVLGYKRIERAFARWRHAAHVQARGETYGRSNNSATTESGGSADVERGGIEHAGTNAVEHANEAETGETQAQ